MAWNEGMSGPVQSITPEPAIIDLKNDTGVPPDADGSVNPPIEGPTDLDDQTGSVAGGVAITDVSTVVTGVDGTANNAASKADVDARLAEINDNFHIMIAAINTLMDNLQDGTNLATLTDKTNEVLAAIRANRQINP